MINNSKVLLQIHKKKKKNSTSTKSQKVKTKMVLYFT